MGSTYYEFRDAFENGNTRVHPTKPGNIQLISDKLNGGDYYYLDKPMSQQYNKRNGYAFVSILNKDRKRCVVKICSNTPPTEEQLHKVIDHSSESKSNLSHEQFQQLADKFTVSILISGKVRAASFCY